MRSARLNSPDRPSSGATGTKKQYILAHELGTSSNKAVLTTVFGEIVVTAQQSYPLYHPSPGFAEEDPSDWWKAVCATTRAVLRQAKVSPKNVVGVTFSSLMQTLVPISNNGTPLCRAMTWLDGRSAEVIHEKLWTPPRVLGYNIFRLLRFLRITGGTPGHTGKDQIGKILWLREHQPNIFARTAKFIDAKDFLVYKLTGKIVTSVDVAAVWWLLDTRNNRNQWDPGLCSLAGISPERLSEVRESSDIVGFIAPQAAKEIGLLPGTPVINGAGDMAAAAVGSGAVDEGSMHINLGTSSWVGGHFARRKIDLAHYTGCVGSAFPQKFYLGMAHQETAGVCLEWLKNKVLYHEEQLKAEAGVSKIYELLDRLAERVDPGAGGLMFTPWMFGERSPLDDSFVRAGLYNLGLQHSREHIIRAVLEGIAFNTRWAMETLENLYAPVAELNMVGGGAKSPLWCQIMADITNRTIHQVSDPHLAGAKGVALLASVALGFIPSSDDIKRYISIKKTYRPNPANRQLYDRLFTEFKNIYRQNKRWYRRMNSQRDVS
jgi:xylulokinase